MLSEATPLKEEFTMKIIDYIMVHATTPVGLTDKVREKIAEGYQPFGNMVYANGAAFQPMVKYSS